MALRPERVDGAERRNDGILHAHDKYTTSFPRGYFTPERPARVQTERFRPTRPRHGGRPSAGSARSKRGYAVEFAAVEQVELSTDSNYKGTGRAAATATTPSARRRRSQSTPTATSALTWYAIRATVGRPRRKHQGRQHRSKRPRAPRKHAHQKRRSHLEGGGEHHVRPTSAERIGLASLAAEVQLAERQRPVREREHAERADECDEHDAVVSEVLEQAWWWRRSKPVRRSGRWSGVIRGRSSLRCSFSPIANSRIARCASTHSSSTTASTNRSYSFSSSRSCTCTFSTSPSPPTDSSRDL